MSENNQDVLEALKNISDSLEKLKEINKTIKKMLMVISVGICGFATAWGCGLALKQAIWVFIIGGIVTEIEQSLIESKRAKK